MPHNLGDATQATYSGVLTKRPTGDARNVSILAGRSTAPRRILPRRACRPECVFCCTSRPMITGAHAIIYSSDADADRAFLKDVLKLSHVDVGGGWLIFA